LRTGSEAPDGAFFLFVSKGFSRRVRPAETDETVDIGL